jgi:thiol:disulfide interchange protein
MERTTFRAPAVKERLAGYIVVKFKAEDLTDKAIREVADYFGVKGLPMYVVLKQRSAVP